MSPFFPLKGIAALDSLSPCCLAAYIIGSHCPFTISFAEITFYLSNYLYLHLMRCAAFLKLARGYESQ